MYKIALVVVLLALISFSSAAPSRTFTFKNQCNFPVWPGIISGATGSCANGCPPGSSCNNVNGICFWNAPTPTNGNYQLSANGGSNEFVFNDGGNSDAILFSGAIAGRVGCSNNAPCQSANCGPDFTGGCLLGGGFQQPATQAEFTLSKNNADFYDVEIINGFNIPVSMTAQTPATGDSPYHCGNPGSRSPKTRVGGASWNFNPPNNLFAVVTNGGNNCNSNNDCGGRTCGLQNGVNNLQTTCGDFLGYRSWSAICQINPGYENCNQHQNQNPAFTFSDLYQCNGAPSCYQPNTNPTCCGCVNWDQLGLNVPPAPNTTACFNQNPEWIANILPQLQWLKEACPTCYTFPYDDSSSTFTCTQDFSMRQQNNVNYLITFCP